MIDYTALVVCTTRTSLIIFCSSLLVLGYQRDIHAIQVVLQMLVLLRLILNLPMLPLLMLLLVACCFQQHLSLVQVVFASADGGVLRHHRHLTGLYALARQWSILLGAAAAGHVAGTTSKVWA